MERMYRLSEVADLWSYDRTTVLRWVQSGRLRAVRTPGGQWRVSESALDAFRVGLEVSDGRQVRRRFGRDASGKLIRLTKVPA